MIKNWKESLLTLEATVKDAKRVIDSSSMRVAFVVSEQGKLLGIVTQSDYRKGLLKYVDDQAPVTAIMNESPSTVLVTESESKIREFFIKTHLAHLPVVDEDGMLISVEYYDEHLKIDSQDNWIVIMAGGLGSRLRPLTAGIPKPLLKVGAKPILETIIENCISSGFKKFYLSVNYKAQMIEDHFGDGSNWGVQISYLKEEKQKGTAGSLSLLPEIPPKPFLVINADLVTDLNFQDLISFHLEHKVVATMCVKEYEFAVPYGVVRVNDGAIEKIDEKPIHKFFVNAGVYVLDPKVLAFLPENKSLDMTDLFSRVIDDNQNTAVFPIHEYWLDIGCDDDYQHANRKVI
jgi:dTDP-glucose pyrophosphorylase|tara:strand:+ start:1936 stop:2976 length:1041 start_codon:yes stop_codon:yes gene_type:complete